MNALALMLMLVASPTGDWTVARSVDPMTDKPRCLISSPSAKVALAVNPDRVMFVTRSAYTRDSLTIRVDDEEAITLDIRGRSTDAFKDDARRVLEQISQGKRIRVSFRDYPYSQTGDAPVADLPALIASCR